MIKMNRQRLISPAYKAEMKRLSEQFTRDMATVWGFARHLRANRIGVMQ